MSAVLRTNTSTDWETEYDRGGIPSSVRSEPSRVVTEFIQKLDLKSGRYKHAVDIGCGSGRNSIYLAKCGLHVVAMDYAATQVTNLKNLSRDLGLSGCIDPVQQDVTQPWPITDATIDVAIDTYCFKHQIERSAIEAYLSELRRTNRAGARYLLFLAAKQDGYYKQFPIDEQDGLGLIIRDPGNGILSRLYDEGEIEDLFSGFSVIDYQVKEARNVMHGLEYDRASHVWVLEKESSG